MTPGGSSLQLSRHATGAEHPDVIAIVDRLGRGRDVSGAGARWFAVPGAVYGGLIFGV